LFSDRWKALTRAEAVGAARVGQLSSERNGQAPLRGLDPRPVVPVTRHSNGLEQFFSNIQDQPGLNLLDLAGASQANIGFITDLGHRLYSEDLVQSLDFAFGDGDFFANQSDPDRLAAFMNQTLMFPADQFNGALVWDVLEFLSPPLLKAVVDRLYHVLRPKSYLLAIFHSDERAEVIPAYSYRISDASTLLLSSRALRRPAQHFNNRAVEKVFHSFESVKFFLSRDSLREVIVKR
jgi:hypothetical protein